jgi:hypothetical protein
MKQHTITVAEVNRWVAGRWVQYAASHSANGDTNKHLDMNMEGLYRVTDHDKILYIGGTLDHAVKAYNSAP